MFLGPLFSKVFQMYAKGGSSGLCYIFFWDQHNAHFRRRRKKRKTTTITTATSINFFAQNAHNPKHANINENNNNRISQLCEAKREREKSID